MLVDSYSSKQIKYFEYYGWMWRSGLLLLFWLTSVWIHKISRKNVTLSNITSAVSQNLGYLKNIFWITFNSLSFIRLGFDKTLLSIDINIPLNECIIGIISCILIFFYVVFNEGDKSYSNSCNILCSESTLIMIYVLRSWKVVMCCCFKCY